MFRSHIFHAGTRVVCHTGYMRRRLTTTIFTQLANRPIEPSFLRFASSKGVKNQYGQEKGRDVETRVLQQKQAQAAQDPSNQVALQSTMKIASKADKPSKSHEQWVNSKRQRDSETPGPIGKSTVPHKTVKIELSQVLRSVEIWILELMQKNQPCSPRLGAASSDRDLVGEQATLEDRMRSILHGLIVKLPHGNGWNHFFQEKTIEERGAEILQLIPRAVRRILAAPKPPDISDFRTLKLEKTGKRGVNGHIFQTEPANCLQKPSSIYVDSVTRKKWGPLGQQWDDPSPQRFSKLNPLIPKHGLDRMIHFTLFSLPAESLDNYDVMEAEKLVILGETVLAVWLGAFDNNGKLLLRSLCPWDLKQISYEGRCRYSPLARNVNLVDVHIARLGRSS